MTLVNISLRSRLVWERVISSSFKDANIRTMYVDRSCISSRNKHSTFTGENNPSSYCVNLVRKYDYENYLCLLLLPKSLRRTAFAIRAFNVEISQIKDMVSNQAFGDMRMQFWKDTLENIYAKQPPQQPVALELAQVLKSVDLSKRWFKKLIDSRAARLVDHSFNSIQEVENYSENSVSAVYYLLLEALGLKNINADHAASHVGKSQGLTNLLRAIPYYLKNGKVLLPNEILIKYKLSHEQILRGSSGNLLENVVFDIATAAHQHVKLVSTEKYLSVLEKGNFNPFDKRLQIRNSWLPCNLLWSKILKRY